MKPWLSFARLLRVSAISRFYMLAVYADESGKHLESPRFVIAGFRAGVRTWARLSERWESALAECAIPVFHASECENGKGRVFGKMSRPDREAIQKRFIGVVNQFPVTAVVFSIPRRLHPSAVSVIRSPRYRSSPYFFIFQSFVVQMLQLSNPHSLRASFFFDRQDEFRATAEAIYERMKTDPTNELSAQMGPILFASKTDRETIALQAADLLAYEGYRHLNAPKARPRWQAAMLFQPLIRKRRLVIKEWDLARIRQLQQHRLPDLPQGSN